MSHSIPTTISYAHSQSLKRKEVEGQRSVAQPSFSEQKDKTNCQLITRAYRTMCLPDSSGSPPSNIDKNLAKCSCIQKRLQRVCSGFYTLEDLNPHKSNL